MVRLLCPAVSNWIPKDADVSVQAVLPCQDTIGQPYGLWDSCYSASRHNNSVVWGGEVVQRY